MACKKCQSADPKIESRTSAKKLLKFPHMPYSRSVAPSDASLGTDHDCSVLYVASGVAAVGGLLFGYDIGVISGGFGGFLFSLASLVPLSPFISSI